jgi:outer membrane protein
MRRRQRWIKRNLSGPGGLAGRGASAALCGLGVAPTTPCAARLASAPSLRRSGSRGLVRQAPSGLGHPRQPPPTLLAAALFAAVAWSSTIEAEQEPLWEIGLGLGALGYADYRGANSSHVFPAPVPYVNYNGPFLKADREGLHGALVHEKLVELTLSFDAAPPASNDRTRSGMTQLKPTVEAGVSLDFHVWRSDDDRMKIVLKVPLRTVFTIQAPPQDIGWTLTPGVDIQLDDPRLNGWKLGFFTGPLFADRRYNNYFYTVPPQNATSYRPAYEATGGYAGYQFNWTFAKRFPHHWVGAFMRYDTLGGAVFDDSPLVRRDYYWTAGFAIAWMIGRSSQMVEVP